MNLIIVESPTKAKTLSRFLGDGYSVEATTGHIKDLPKSTLGVDVEHDFKPEYIEVEKRKETIKSIQSKSKKAEKIYIATDPDREGEAIASHVEDMLRSNLKLKIKNLKLKRATFHEITKEAVQHALDNPTEINRNLVDAQTARRVLDRLVGYKLSPVLWRKVRIGLSAGRVQSVTLRLIVEKEREIEKFKADEYWEIYVNVKCQMTNDKFTIQLVNEKVINKDRADKIVKELRNAKYQVKDVRKKQVSKSPYPPFTTSTMQQAGSRIFGWSAKKTMQIAQGLYEEGLITYHRTDSLNLNSKAVENARSFIGENYGKNYLPEKARFYKTTSKVAQEAHEAIRPTDINSKFEIQNSKFSGDGGKLYDLIKRRFLATQMSAATYDETVIDVGAGEYLLRASGQVMKFDGWRKLFPIDKDVVILPEVQKEQVLDLIKVWGKQKYTQPPARFNEASLIKTLEKLGIGRPSTYAPTISTIQVRQYVEKNDSKQFVPTSIGFAVNDFLIANFADVFEYQFTAQMEDSLDKIADGKLPWVKVIRDFYNPFEKKVEDVTKNSVRVKIEVEKLGKPCPECKEGELVIRTGRFGKFISCSRFPDCKYTEKYLEKIGVKCPDCKIGEVIVKKSRKGKFFGCSRYPDCKYASWKSPKKDGV